MAESPRARRCSTYANLPRLRQAACHRLPPMLTLCLPNLPFSRQRLLDPLVTPDTLPVHPIRKLQARRSRFGFGGISSSRARGRDKRLPAAAKPGDRAPGVIGTPPAPPSRLACPLQELVQRCGANPRYEEVAREEGGAARVHTKVGVWTRGRVAA